MRTLSLTLLLALGLAAPAGAGQVSYSPGPDTLTYTDVAGEANNLQVSRAGERIVFTELDGLLITATPGAQADCDGDGAGAVVACRIPHDPANPVAALALELGGEADRLAIADPLSGFALDAQGEAGADRLDAAVFAGTALLRGQAGADTLLAGRGETVLFGDEGDDTLGGGAIGGRVLMPMGAAPDGADMILGGPGLDIVEYDSRPAALRLSADGVADDGEPGELDNLGPAVEALQGGGGADVLVASAQVDAQLSGYGGNDQLLGGPGDDTLFGGAGDDTLAGGAGDDLAEAGDEGSVAIGGGPVDAGSDSFAGGAGFDTADYTTRAGVVLTLDGIANDGGAGEADNVGGDVEQLLGSPGSDTIVGDAGAQRIIAGSGNDTITPGGGTDQVRAGDGDDSVAAQDDTIDVIACGVGTDTLAGDGLDVIDGCENATLTAPPLPPDTRKPTVVLRADTSVRFGTVRRGMRVRVDADEPVSYTIELRGRARSARLARVYNLTLVKRTFARTDRIVVARLKPRRALLGPRRRLRLQVRVTATDAAGNRATATRTIRVRR